MPAVQESVLNCVKARTSTNGSGRVIINLNKNDAARLLQALERENALRGAAYWVIENRKSYGYKNNNSEVIARLEAALGQKLTQGDLIAELTKLAQQGVDKDYFLDRAKKLMERVS